MAARTPQEKFPLIFEAAKRTLLAYDALLRRLLADLDRITPLVDRQDPIESSEIAETFIAAMGLVDFAYRFDQLVDALPLINKKSAELRALRATLAPAEPARHHLQHMRGDLNDPGAIDYPILGSLAWARESTCYTLSFSQPGASVPTLIWDRQEVKFVEPLEYIVKGLHIRPLAMAEEMHRAFQSIVSLIDFAPAEYKWGSTSAFRISFANRGEGQQDED